MPSKLLKEINEQLGKNEEPILNNSNILSRLETMFYYLRLTKTLVRVQISETG